MPDLRTLLHDAAPVPSRPLDMADIRRRARRRRTVVSWLAGLGAVIGVAVPVAGPALAPGGSQARLQTVEQTTTTVADGPTRLDGERTDGDGARTGPERKASVLAAGRRAEAGPPLPARAGAPAPAQPGDGGPAVLTAAEPVAYPPAASCAVDNAGLAGGGQRRCRFTATAPGGASMTTTGPVSPPPGMRGEVIVTRNGETTVYEVHDDVVRAGEVGTVRCTARPIEPGDLVEVVLTNADVPDGHRTTLGAGESWECWNTRGQE